MVNSLDGRNIGTDTHIGHLPSYLDNKLWHEEKRERLIYNKTVHKFMTKNESIFKFRFEGESDLTNHDSGGAANVASSFLKRRRRHVFGKDNRFHVTHQYVEEFPFQSVVRLGNGCSGTLIWYKHVLTSAHCVHDRRKYKPAVEDLRIGLLRTDGTFKWIGARRVHVPNGWIRKRGMLYLNHDYAVIELKEPHWRRYMDFGTFNIDQIQFIQFAGFPSDKRENEMWYSYCSIRLSYKHLFLNYCDATSGMSGSGVYIYSKYNDIESRKLVAVFSSYISVSQNGGYRRMNLEANVAVRLTSKKVRRICKWMNAGYNCSKLKSLQPDQNRPF